LCPLKSGNINGKICPEKASLANEGKKMHFYDFKSDEEYIFIHFIHSVVSLTAGP
jgi:hypothetical protein